MLDCKEANAEYNLPSHPAYPDMLQTLPICENAMPLPLKSITKPAFAQWLVLVFVWIILGGAIAFNLFLEHGRTAKREQDRLLTQARVIAENMESLLASANRGLEGVRADVAKQRNAAGSEAANSHLKALANVMPGIRYIGVMDAKGLLRASNLTEFVDRDFSYREYFQTVKQHPNADTLYVSPPFKSAAGPHVINVTRMIPGPHGEFAGIVTASLDPVYFNTLMKSVLYAPDMWDSIGHGDGLLFLMLPEREGIAGMNLARPGTFFTQFRESGKVALVLTGTVYATKEVRMIAQHSVQPEFLKMDKPLVVAISRDLDGIFQPWRSYALTQAGLFGLLIVASFLALRVYQRRQRKFEQQAAEAAAAVQQSTERLQLATDAAGMGVWDYDVVTGELVWDDSMYAIYGIDKAASPILYDTWHNCVIPEDHPAAEAALTATLEHGAPYTPSFRIRRGDGALRYIQARARIYSDAAGKPVRLVGINEDITERHQQEAALQESEERFRSTFSAAAIGMALVSLEGRFIQVNDALCKIVGYTAAELQQKTFQDITHPDDLEADLALAQELLDGIRASYQMEKRYFHKDGSIIWVLLSGATVRDSSGKVLYFIAQIQDITERRQLLEKLDQQANQDYLTGLFNRRYFMEQGKTELAREQRFSDTLSLLMLDIDHFKNINDTHGHKAGDIVLQKLSEIMRETLRTFDIIGRLGGEEFAIMLPETDLQKAIEVAERLRERVASTDVVLEAGLPLRFTVSIGVVTLKEKGINLDILLNQADQALYQAKQGGRNKVCVA